VNSEAFCNLDNDGVLDVNGISRGAISIRTGRRAYRAKADGDHPLIDHKPKKLGLLKVRMQFHLVANGCNPGIPQ
jgi:hypothetical protein